MYRTLVGIFTLTVIVTQAQNDLDAIRYSRVGVGGTARFVAMGGAFGAVGADLSCAAYNPAGLGIYRTGAMAISAGLKTNNNSSSIYNRSSDLISANVAFSNLGIALNWPSKGDADSRHLLAFTNTQLQNFSNSVGMSGYTNSQSIAKDMLNLANQYKPQSGNITNNLYSSYEGLGFNTFLLDTFNNKFFSNLDLKRSVRQTRDIVTTGRVNDLNFSYAYSFKDDSYFGVSLGLPQVKYTSTTTHREYDDKDSMRVTITSPTSYTTTYVDGLPAVYPTQLGFNNLTYTEYFKTSGSGVNLKLGFIKRISDHLRLGAFYHTRTIYTMQDSYYSSLSVSYDYAPGNPTTVKDPTNGGTFSYKIITPARMGLNAAYILDKKAVIAVDFERVNYSGAQLTSTNVADFAGVNTVIKNKYKAASNIRVGAEYNLNPVMLRVGYNMQGSPFGDVFTGNFVRNTFSAGFGFRTKNNLSLDFTMARTMSNENYYLFSTFNTVSKIKYNSTMLTVTLGIKF